MVKQIVRDILFFGQKSEEATEEDKQVITDLHDTLAAHREGSVAGSPADADRFAEMVKEPVRVEIKMEKC